MLASAEYSYKTTIRTGQLKKLFRGGSRQWEQMPALAKVRYEKVRENSKQQASPVRCVSSRSSLILPPLCACDCRCTTILFALVIARWCTSIARVWS